MTAGRELSGARFVVAGATGVLGRGITRALVDRGSRVVPGGRDADRLADLGRVCGTEPVVFDAVDADSCTAAVVAAAEQLGGLDGIVVTVGVPAFGPAVDADPAVVDELFAVDVLGPMALVRAAVPHLETGGVVACFSAILADLPTPGMADYSAAKSALSVWLGVLRRENRRRFTVLDLRPPHLDTGLETRGLAGEPPRLPPPLAGDEVVAATVEALASGASELVWDPSAQALSLR